jgi:acyl-CoA thioesterase
LADLLRLLELERLEINLFRGESRDIGSPQVFGGQVLGQALMAASATVDARLVHSLHAYFLRRGDFNASIVYEVDRSLDGSSFSNRRVVAIQHGKQIFHLSASFQRHEEGAQHHVPAPRVTPPEQLKGPCCDHALSAPGHAGRAADASGRSSDRSSSGPSSRSRMASRIPRYATCGSASSTARHSIPC